MPVAHHQRGIDLFDTTHERTRSLRFLNRCQQQAIQTQQAKIASLTFGVEPIAPWVALSVLGTGLGGDQTGAKAVDRDTDAQAKKPPKEKGNKRHVYYDSPQQLSRVGVGVAVGFSASGAMRFAQAQDFINFWQRQFLYADPIGNALYERQDEIQAHARKGHFFCSATFFAAIAPEPAHFEPAHVFVPEVQVTTSAKGSAVTFNCLVSATTDTGLLLEKIYRQLRRLVIAEISGDQRPTDRVRPTVYKDVADFEGAVTAALDQVRDEKLTAEKLAAEKLAGKKLAGEKLHKVVLADVMDVVGSQPVDVVRSLQTLRQNHPDCTVFSVGNGRGQVFIGASPERLLRITDGQLMTEALAGSASRSPNPGIDRQLAQTLLNSQKERYEHRVVVEFIVEQLRSLGLTPHHDVSPQLLQLLHIQHLHTPISAKLNAQQSVQPLDILAKLHPTPAVAGLPRKAACEFIQQHETFDRGLYTAPLGWVDTDGNSEFIVGIRSALIDGCKARLYAGAGIVAGSEPAKELAEIKLKLQTLLNALV